jgi:HNH endonuclease
MHNGYAVRIDSHGYPYIYEPTFSADKQWRRLPRGWHLEHRVIATRMLNRPIEPWETVHHINGDKTDNRPENLTVMSRRDHRKLHNDEIDEKLRRLAEYERRFGPLNLNDQLALEAAQRELRKIGTFKES